MKKYPHPLFFPELSSIATHPNPQNPWLYQTLNENGMYSVEYIVVVGPDQVRDGTVSFYFDGACSLPCNPPMQPTRADVADDSLIACGVCSGRPVVPDEQGGQVRRSTEAMSKMWNFCGTVKNV